MSSFTIRQRTRENQIVKTYSGATITTGIGAVTGIDTDGGFFWLTSFGAGLTSGVLDQIELPSASVIREITLGFSGNGTSNADLCNDGENFGLVHGLSTATDLTSMDRNGNRLTSIIGLGNEGSGIAFDGEFFYVTVADPLGFTPPTIEQYARIGNTFVLVRTVTLSLGSAAGLAFDGEFLVTHPLMPATALTTMDLYYLERQNMTVVKTWTGEAGSATHQNGMTFDGEYIYTLESSAE